MPMARPIVELAAATGDIVTPPAIGGGGDVFPPPPADGSPPPGPPDTGGGDGSDGGGGEPGGGGGIDTGGGGPPPEPPPPEVPPFGSETKNFMEVLPKADGSPDWLESGSSAAHYSLSAIFKTPDRDKFVWFPVALHPDFSGAPSPGSEIRAALVDAGVSPLTVVGGGSPGVIFDQPHQLAVNFGEDRSGVNFFYTTHQGPFPTNLADGYYIVNNRDGTFSTPNHFFTISASVTAIAGCEATGMGLVFIADDHGAVEYFTYGGGSATYVGGTTYRSDGTSFSAVAALPLSDGVHVLAVGHLTPPAAFNWKFVARVFDTSTTPPTCGPDLDIGGPDYCTFNIACMRQLSSGVVAIFWSASPRGGGTTGTPVKITRVTVSGSTATIVGTESLDYASATPPGPIPIAAIGVPRSPAVWENATFEPGTGATLPAGEVWWGADTGVGSYEVNYAFRVQHALDSTIGVPPNQPFADTDPTDADGSPHTGAEPPWAYDEGNNPFWGDPLAAMIEKRDEGTTVQNPQPSTNQTKITHARVALVAEGWLLQRVGITQLIPPTP